MKVMRRVLGISLASCVLFACGGDDDGDGGEPEPTCAIGATLTGDVERRISVDEESTACLVSQSFDSGIFASFAPDLSGLSLAIDIANVTEGQTGSGFPTEIEVTSEDDRRYSTSPSGCTSTITEHSLQDSQMSELGEERNYRLVGTATCTEPALPDDGGSGQVSITDVAFVFTAFWGD